MSGAEAAALALGLVSSALSVFEAAYQVYSAAHDAKGLTEEFREAAEQIPLILHTLALVDNSLRRGDPSTEAINSVKPILERCKKKAASIKSTFDKALPSRGATRMERYKKAAHAKRKTADVQSKMTDVMKDLSLLQQHRIFLDSETLEDIKSAVTQLSPPKGGENKTTFAHEGIGNIYGYSGSGNQENHSFINSGAGDFYCSTNMTINKGKFMEL